MKKIKDLILVVVLVFATTFIASLGIKLFINNEASLFVSEYYLLGLTLPIIQLLFEKDFTKKKLLIPSIGYPLVMTFTLYFTDF